LSSTAPLSDIITPAAGTGTEAARGDHRHPLGGPLHNRFQTGAFYGAYTNALTNTAGSGAGLLHATPIFIAITHTFDQIAVNVSTAGAGAIRLGIYNDNGSGYPSTLLAAYGTVSVGVAAQVAITISQQLTPGQYWLAALSETTTDPVVTAANGMVIGVPYFPVGVTKGFQATGVAAGALPATFPTGLAATTSPLWRVLLRAA
jgi:hypothetical protein